MDDFPADSPKQKKITKMMQQVKSQIKRTSNRKPLNNSSSSDDDDSQLLASPKKTSPTTLSIESTPSIEFVSDDDDNTTVTAEKPVPVIPVEDADIVEDDLELDILKAEEKLGLSVESRPRLLKDRVTRIETETKNRKLQVKKDLQKRMSMIKMDLDSLEE